MNKIETQQKDGNNLIVENDIKNTNENNPILSNNNNVSKLIKDDYFISKMIS